MSGAPRQVLIRGTPRALIVLGMALALLHPVTAPPATAAIPGTNLTLKGPVQVPVGETAILSGKFTLIGAPLAYRTVALYMDWRLLTTTTTDLFGNWRAEIPVQKEGARYFQAVADRWTNTETWSNAHYVIGVVPPSAPLNPAVIVHENALQVTLSWSPPTKNGGASITQYHLATATAPEGPWVPLTSVFGGTLSHTLPWNGQSPYHFSVRAENMAGIGLAAIGAPTTSPPGEPTNLTWEAPGGTLTLRWEPPANGTGGTLQGYRIHRKDGDSAPFELLATVPGTTRSYATPVLTNRNVTYQVTGINVAGASVPASVTTHVQGPEAPTNFTAVPHLASITLTWSAPPETHGHTITYYKLTRSVVGSGTWRTLAYLSYSATATYTDSDRLTSSTDYIYHVVAVTSTGLSGSPAEVAVSTPPSSHMQLRVGKFLVCHAGTTSCVDAYPGDTIRFHAGGYHDVHVAVWGSLTYKGEKRSGIAIDGEVTEEPEPCEGFCIAPIKHETFTATTKEGGDFAAVTAPFRGWHDADTCDVYYYVATATVEDLTRWSEERWLRICG